MRFFFKKEKHGNTKMDHVLEKLHTFQTFCQFENRNEMYTFLEHNNVLQ